MTEQHAFPSARAKPLSTPKGVSASAQPIRLALLAASPVYYHAPLFRRLHADPRLDFTAVFESYDGARPSEAGYGRTVDFGIDPLEGYRSIFLRSAASTSVDALSPLAVRDPDVVRVLLREDYEILFIHGYSFLAHILAACTHRLRRRPLIWREEQTLLHPRPLWKRAVRAAVLRALLSGSYALYIGTENRRWFRHYGVPDDRLFFAPYAVDNELLQREAGDLRNLKLELREQLGLDLGKPVILSVSRLIAKKQPLFLLDAFARARREHDCALLVVGTGELEDAMRERVRRDAIPDVVFAGFRSQREIARVYAAADVFVLFSRIDETWGVVVNEAMNFGLPIVVSDKVGSATDLVRTGENGFVVGRDDRSGLAAALGRLVESPDLRARYGRASLELVERWNHDVAAAGVIDAVATAVGAERWARAQPAAD